MNKTEALNTVVDELTVAIEQVLTTELFVMLERGATEDECITYLTEFRGPQIKSWVRQQIQRIGYEMDGVTLQ